MVLDLGGTRIHSNTKPIHGFVPLMLYQLIDVVTRSAIQTFYLGDHWESTNGNFTLADLM